MLGIDLSEYEQHICINGCFLFPPLAREDWGADESSCPTCQQPRFLLKNGKYRPQKKFYALPVKEQILNLLNREDVHNSIQVLKEKLQEDHAPEVSFWNGKLAQNYQRQGIFNNLETEVALSIGIDGAEIFRKGSNSVTVLAGKLWNLDPAFRTKTQNLVLYSVVFGKISNFDPYIQCLSQELKQLEGGKIESMP